jgi:hypothetical protein
LREFLGNNNGMRRSVIGRRKNRSRFVRIPAAVALMTCLLLSLLFSVAFWVMNR